MNAIDTMKTDLQWNVLTIKWPGLVRDLPPGKEELRWVANSSTLISGEHDAILVDTFLTTEQSQTLSTTESIPTSARPTDRAGLSGSPRSTSLRPGNPKPWSPGIRCWKTTMISASLARRDNTFAISTARTKQLRTLVSSMTRCLISIQTGSIWARFGAQPTPRRKKHRVVPPTNVTARPRLTQRGSNKRHATRKQGHEATIPSIRRQHHLESILHVLSDPAGVQIFAAYAGNSSRATSRSLARWKLTTEI